MATVMRSRGTRLPRKATDCLSPMVPSPEEAADDNPLLGSFHGVSSSTPTPQEEAAADGGDNDESESFSLLPPPSAVVVLPSAPRSAPANTRNAFPSTRTAAIAAAVLAAVVLRGSYIALAPRWKGQSVDALSRSYKWTGAPYGQSVDALSRPYEWTGAPYGWCVDPSNDVGTMNGGGRESQEPTGLLFVKVTKSASSTGAGITLRIAVNLFRRIMKKPEEEEEDGDAVFVAKDKGREGRCRAKYSHGNTTSRGYGRRDRARSLLWSIVRSPAQRSVSHVWFADVSRKGENTTDENVIRLLSRENFRNFQSKHLKTRNSPGKEDDDVVAVRDIMADYDFLAVAERMDESMVAMKMILGLDLGDLLYLSSKTNGGYDDGNTKQGCVKIRHANVSETVSSFLANDFPSMNGRDMLLYEVANRSLDKTIERLGREEFEEQLGQYRKFLKMARDRCQDTADFPCSPNGTLQREKSSKNCYLKDWGCGYTCIDQFISDYAGGN